MSVPEKFDLFRPVNSLRWYSYGIEINYDFFEKARKDMLELLPAIYGFRHLKSGGLVAYGVTRNRSFKMLNEVLASDLL